MPRIHVNNRRDDVQPQCSRDRNDDIAEYRIREQIAEIGTAVSFRSYLLYAFDRQEHSRERHVNGKYSETDKGERVALVRPLWPITEREDKASE
jgi:hypothetical protein